MEHAVSDLLVDRIDEFLGRPELDPHGDPIPRSDGSIAVQKQTPLSQCPLGNRVILQRVLDQNPELLRFLTEGKLEIGACLTITRRETTAGTITVTCQERETTLSVAAAEALMTQPPDVGS